MADISSLIDEFVRRDASDLYISVGARPSVRSAQGVVPISPDPLTEEDVQAAILGILPESVMDEFSSTLEYNTAINWRHGAYAYQPVPPAPAYRHGAPPHPH